MNKNIYKWNLLASGSSLFFLFLHTLIYYMVFPGYVEFATWHSILLFLLMVSVPIKNIFRSQKELIQNKFYLFCLFFLNLCGMGSQIYFGFSILEKRQQFEIMSSPWNVSNKMAMGFSILLLISLVWSWFLQKEKIHGKNNGLYFLLLVTFLCSCFSLSSNINVLSIFQSFKLS